MSQRIEKIDGIKGFLIVLVVLGHVLELFTGKSEAIATFYKGIYLFHMPAFIMICGFLSREYVDKKSALTILKNILIPFVLFNILYELERYLLGDESFHYLSILAPNWIMWFLLSLLFWKVFLPIIAQIKQPIIWAMLISAGVKMSSIDPYTLAIGRTAHFAPFFIFGLVYKDYIKKILSMESLVTKGLLAFICLGLFYYSMGTFRTSFLWGAHNFYNTGLTDFRGIKYLLKYYAIVFFIVLTLFMIYPKKCLCKIGKQTFPIYLLHGLLIILIAKYIVPFMSYDHLWMMLIISFGLTFILVYVLSRGKVGRIFNKIIGVGNYFIKS